MDRRAGKDARAAARSDLRRRRRRQAAAKGTIARDDDDVIAIDCSDSDSSSSEEEVPLRKGGHKRQRRGGRGGGTQGGATKGGTKGKASGKGGAPCIALLDSSDEDSENIVNHSPPPRGRKRPQPSSGEDADRALAERLQREFDSSSTSGGRANNIGGWDLYGGRARGAGSVTGRPRALADTGRHADDRALAERLQREEHAANGRSYPGPPRRKLEPPSIAAAATPEHRRAAQALKAQQDDEYEETLLADQIRDIAKREAEENDRRERIEAEERERRAREEKEDANTLNRATEASALDAARATVANHPEPPADAKGVARLRIVLPNGKKLERRFLPSDAIAAVRAYVFLHFHEKGMAMTNVGLSTNFPKREYGADDGEMTLEEAGLIPRAVVLVHDLDA